MNIFGLLLWLWFIAMLIFIYKSYFNSEKKTTDNGQLELFILHSEGKPFTFDPVNHQRVWLNEGDTTYQDKNGCIWNLI